MLARLRFHLVELDLRPAKSFTGELVRGSPGDETAIRLDLTLPRSRWLRE
jgi:hypothetical protein